MESLKQLGTLGRQHYEKIILTLALVGLAFTAWLLWARGQEEAEKIQTYLSQRPRSAPKAVDSVDLSTNQMALQAVADPVQLSLAPPHNLLNPVKWQKRPDGQLLKIETGEEVGAAQMRIEDIEPLYYRITLDRFTAGQGGGLPTVFYLSVLDETAAPHKRLARRQPFYINATDNRKNSLVTLLEVKGTPEEPELVFELNDTQKRITVSKSQPYEEERAYEADLRYAIDDKTFRDAREGDTIRFGGDEYKIIAIREDEVVLSALLNDKKHTIKRSAGG